MSLSVILFQFFNTKPHACNPSSLPKYPPSKEFDAKLRAEEIRRYYTNFQENAAKKIDTKYPQNLISFVQQ